MTLETLKEQTVISTPNDILTMKSGCVEMIVNTVKTTPTLEKRKNTFGASQVGQLFDQVEAQESKDAQR